MHKYLKFSALALLFCGFIQAQDRSFSHYEEVMDYRKKTDAEFADRGTTPLPPAVLDTFSGLKYFPVDSMYRVVARFVRTEEDKPFEMTTTTSRRPMYQKFGELHFRLDTLDVVLEVFQNLQHKKMAEFRDHLFLPFKDMSNGEESYGGGRYLDMSIPQSDTVIIDFNKAYNPYCAYNERYSCPVPPPQNFIPYRILAGVRKFDSH